MPPANSADAIVLASPKRYEVGAILAPKAHDQPNIGLPTGEMVSLPVMIMGHAKKSDWDAYLARSGHFYNPFYNDFSNCYFYFVSTD